MILDSRYQTLKQRFLDIDDFPPEFLAISRNLFDFNNGEIVPKRFEVWTTLVGLPLPQPLTTRFESLFDEIIKLLPNSTRFYKVRPQNYHWELFIIKRPDETVEEKLLIQTTEIIRQILNNFKPFKMSYRGFLITPDGTIIVKGYGEFDQLREQLRQQISWASPQQSNLGHISLGRILDPVGEVCFRELKQLVQTSENDEYGELNINCVKYVHESQWYMETQEVVSTFNLR
ncbi:hypothetical protein ACL6C3_10215 [Capilliphycus salinus ALCB114379]|uniref:hypothetical protein n=1 Tax=Capilliphycus salinus TaxID=2768948 RepID=UPI0039A6555E